MNASATFQDQAQNDTRTNRLIPLSDAAGLKSAGILPKQSLLRQWRFKNQHPELFVKVAGRVYVSLDGWQSMLDAAEAERAAACWANERPKS